MNILEAKLSIRATNCLMHHGITTVEQLMNVKVIDLINIKTLGNKAFQEIVDFIKENNPNK